MHLSVHSLTVLVSVVAISTLITTYSLSVTKHQLPKLLPTISETGDNLPERCIFSFGMAFTAFLLSVLIFLVYLIQMHYICVLQIQELDRVSSALSCWVKTNRDALIFGEIEALALLFVATFQSDAVPYVHYIAAITLFVCSWLFCILCTVMSADFRKWGIVYISEVNHKFKVLITCLHTIAMIVTVSGVLYLSRNDHVYWSMFAGFEYLLFVCVCAFLLSYWDNFKYFYLTMDLSMKATPYMPIM